MIESDVEKRLPVWHALSDIFLDTELQPEDYCRIAAVLRSSGYSTVELRTIFEGEVAPAFAFNMVDVAGEWTSWTEAGVREIMLRSFERKRNVPPVPWLKRRIYRRHVAQEWSKLEQLLEAT